jgi:hypothetical protein
MFPSQFHEISDTQTPFEKTSIAAKIHCGARRIYVEMVPGSRPDMCENPHAGKEDRIGTQPLRSYLEPPRVVTTNRFSQSSLHLSFKEFNKRKE